LKQFINQIKEPKPATQTRKEFDFLKCGKCEISIQDGHVYKCG